MEKLLMSWLSNDNQDKFYKTTDFFFLFFSFSLAFAQPEVDDIEEKKIEDVFLIKIFIRSEVKAMSLALNKKR